MNYQGLASTGAGVTLFGVFFGVTTLLWIAAGAILLGAILCRIAWRRHKKAGEA